MADEEQSRAVVDDDVMLEHRLDNITAMVDFLRNREAWTPEDVQRIQDIIREMVATAETTERLPERPEVPEIFRD
jgi:hypothetical protein